MSRAFLQRNNTASNRQMIIASMPNGPLQPSNFQLQVQSDMQELKDGEVRLKTLAITIGAGQRAGLQGSASYLANKPGDAQVMNGTGVGTVVESKDMNFKVGDVVMGGCGWQEFATLPGKALTKVPPGVDPAMQLGLLGTNGLTAYFGLLDIGMPKAGETVLVSAASGSVGHIVGQIAKIKGCVVIGTAGSDEKCQRLIDELGFDHAINYKSDDFRNLLKAATPKKIDVYFDNTGGKILQSALFRMNTFGRIVCCGNVSQYDTSTPGGGPKGVPGMLVNNQVKMQGFIVYSYAKQYEHARQEMIGWANEGKLVGWSTEYQGMERAPHAFIDMLNGVTKGTTIVRF